MCTVAIAMYMICGNISFFIIYVVDGGWSDWFAGNCTASCVKERTRFCNNPVPSCGGQNCTGQAVEIMKCIEFPCEG